MRHPILIYKFLDLAAENLLSRPPFSITECKLVMNNIALGSPLSPFNLPPPPPPVQVHFIFGSCTHVHHEISESYALCESRRQRHRPWCRNSIPSVICVFLNLDIRPHNRKQNSRPNEGIDKGRSLPRVSSHALPMNSLYFGPYLMRQVASRPCSMLV